MTGEGERIIGKTRLHDGKSIGESTMEMDFRLDRKFGLQLSHTKNSRMNQREWTRKTENRGRVINSFIYDFGGGKRENMPMCSRMESCGFFTTQHYEKEREREWAERSTASKIRRLYSRGTHKVFLGNAIHSLIILMVLYASMKKNDH